MKIETLLNAMVQAYLDHQQLEDDFPHKYFGQYLKFRHRILYEFNKLSKQNNENEQLASRRLELLRRWDEYRKHFQQACYFCGGYEHTEDCELARELEREVEDANNS